MKRFDPMWDKMEPFPEGEWVRYEDAQAAVAAERERCAALCDGVAADVTDAAKMGALECWRRLSLGA